MSGIEGRTKTEIKTQREELREAIRKRDEHKVLALLKSTEKLAEIRYENNWTLLHYAARYGLSNICQLLVEEYQVDPHVKESSNYELTALHYACFHNHANTVKYLVIHAHCDPLTKSSIGRTPFSYGKGAETRHFLQEIIDQSRKEGFPNVPDYTKALQWRFNEAMAKGGGDLHQCNIVFHGPPGAGKSSVKALILGKPPRPKHKQTATNIVEKCVRTVTTHRVAASPLNQQCFEEVDNDDIITRITAQVEKYRKQKQSTKPQSCHTILTEENRTVEPSIDTTDSSLPVKPGDCDAHLPRSASTKTVESIRAGLLHSFSSSYKPVFDSRWLHHIDSGGQPQFLDVLPQLYHSPNSHFVVVMRLTDGLDERPKVRFYIEGNDEYCLPDHLVLTNREVIIRMCQVARRISQLHGAREGKFIPCVFVVGTHNDKLLPIIGSRRRRSINAELLPIYEEYKDVLVCKSPGEQVMFMVNAMAKGKERQQHMEELQRHILSATEKACDSIQVPLQWLILHLELDKSEGAVRMKRCLELGSKIGLSKEEVRAALEFLNKAALILYYPDDVPDLVITKMDPFTSRLSKLIKASFITPDNGPSKECDELRKKGVFKKPFLQRVFHDVADHLLSDEEFLKLLESLKIAVHIGGDEYFLPSALSLQPLSDESSTFNTDSNPIVFLWDELILPHGFFLTVSVELQNKNEGEEGYMFELRRDKPQWRGAIQLSEKRKKIPGVMKLIDRKCWIQVSFSGDSSYCPIVYRSVDTAVQRAIKRLQHTGIDYPSIACVCPLCKDNDHPSYISADKKFITCSLDNDKTGPVTPNISCWYEDYGRRNGSNQLSTCYNSKSVDLKLADVLGCIIEVTDWSSLGLALGLPHHEIVRIRRDGYDERDRLTRMVSMWLESGTDPSWEGLVEALCHPLVNEDALAAKIMRRAH